jgi:hypothetical protein
MIEHGESGVMEREVFRASWSDGIVDLYAGLALIWMGTWWIWFEHSAALAGLLPAVLVWPMLELRKRFVEARRGYVRWRAPRRERERRWLWIVLAAGIALLVITAMAIALLADGDGTDVGSTLAPATIAWLLAILVGLLAIVMDLPRFLAYAGLLALGGGVAAALDTSPGWPLLIGGVAATVVGLVLLRRFTARYPRVETS